MFIFITYKDAPELSTTLRRSSSEIDSSVEKRLLVNPNCPVRIMLEYIRKMCRLGVFTTFDICDENGYLKNLFSLPTYTYATSLFEHKKNYYIIVVKQEDKRISVIPQLNHENRIYTSLKDRCKRLLTSGELSPQCTSSQVTTSVKITPPRRGSKKK